MIVYASDIPKEIDNEILYELFYIFGSVKEYKTVFNRNMNRIDLLFLIYREDRSYFYLHKYLNNFNIYKYKIVMHKYENTILNNNGIVIKFESIKPSCYDNTLDINYINEETPNDIDDIKIRTSLDDINHKVSTYVNNNEIFELFFKRKDENVLLRNKCLELQRKIIDKFKKNKKHSIDFNEEEKLFYANREEFMGKLAELDNILKKYVNED